MRKVMIVTMGIVLALPLAAVAGEVTGKIQSIEKATETIVLEDGTQLWVGELQISDLREGDKVRAAFEEQDGKKIVTDLDRRTSATGAEGTMDIESTNLGSSTQRGN
jgi:hypothetical protein